MSILIDENTKVLVQGITGRDGAFHTKQMIDYGTKIVGGVTPGKGGETLHGVPVFNNMMEAVKKTGATASVIYVPAPFAGDAMYEAVESGVKLVVCITEGVPINDSLNVYNYIKGKDVRLIGPNCPGLLSPGKSKIGIMPGHIAKKGNAGVVSKSGTLTYEIVYSLTLKGVGQSTCIGIGGDPIIGTNFIDVLKLFNDDPETKAIAMIGEIGGTDEEEAAEYIKNHVKKPVVAFIAGRTAPEGKRMGHAGAIISGGMGTSESKIKALNAAGVPVCDTPAQVADKIAEKLK
ncbi:MAG: succinate--CoA ligase subunit alpha [Spirochaetota bacterium]|nr:succinate--CoA ligase subunit alpha [Spirochaetota bacterium]